MVKLTWDIIFPNINRAFIERYSNVELPLFYALSDSMNKGYEIKEDVISSMDERLLYQPEVVAEGLKELIAELRNEIHRKKLRSTDWLRIAEKKARINYLAAKAEIEVDTVFVDDAFKNFVMNGYNNLSTERNKLHPMLVNRIPEFVGDGKNKVALIVLDGMSLFDFQVIAEEFDGIDYDAHQTFAMIPTTTAISRQSMLAGEFPVKLERPFNLSREEKQFIERGEKLGYRQEQIQYEKKLDFILKPITRYLTVIINIIDDLVHSQLQGREGMYRDVKQFARSGALQRMVSALSKEGFTIYLTADHGNTLCTGIGGIRGKGIDMESKAKRVLIMKDFAEVDDIKEKYHLMEYPGYYLDKKYKYLISNTGESLDNQGQQVLTHGGISIEEVIVPFIKVKAVQYE